LYLLQVFRILVFNILKFVLGIIFDLFNDFLIFLLNFFDFSFFLVYTTVKNLNLLSMIFSFLSDSCVVSFFQIIQCFCGILSFQFFSYL